jgi:hypothetical protein
MQHPEFIFNKVQDLFYSYRVIQQEAGWYLTITQPEVVTLITVLLLNFAH